MSLPAAPGVSWAWTVLPFAPLGDKEKIWAGIQLSPGVGEAGPGLGFNLGIAGAAPPVHLCNWLGT